MIRVLVLGTNGMLGSMLTRVFQEDSSLEVVTTSRSGDGGSLPFDVAVDSLEELLARAQSDWVVNAVGILARRIDQDDPASVASAIEVNAVFPNRLAAATAKSQRVINFSTDGLFSGRRGPYDERAFRDEDGVYARSKALGEPRARHVTNLRCSIIGLEPPPGASLLGWALAQPAGHAITGYDNHLWNGLTTLHLARICSAVVHGMVPDLPTILHLVPADAVSKAELLSQALVSFGRSDVVVQTEPAAVAVDRRLCTVYPAVNEHLWAAAGYPEPPRIADMVSELATMYVS